MMEMNILIVDDSKVMRQMIIKTLRISGLPLGEIHQASNGLEGLEFLNRQWVDLVILDINMPVMTGEEMMNHMQNRDECKDIPVIVISTEGSTTRIEHMEQLGACFIHKPFSPEKIRDAVYRILNMEDIP
ncbi:MAG: response regulator [Desulfatirhabdiaceae bacterium]